MSITGQSETAGVSRLYVLSRRFGTSNKGSLLQWTQARVSGDGGA